MPYSGHQTPAKKDPPNPADLSFSRPAGPASSDFDRSILGIPAEDDAFSRALISSFDSSTRLPSVPSKSQESEDPSGHPAYGLSHPSNNTSSVRILTPQSTSDASSSLHPRSAPAQSVGSSDGGYSVNGAEELQSLSISLKVATGASEAASSTELTQVQTYLPMTGGQLTSTNSLAVHPSVSEHSGNLDRMNDPRVIIDIGPNDIEYLTNIMRQEDPGRLGIPAQALDPMDLVDDSISQSTTLPRERVSRPSHNLRARRPSSKDEREKMKLMRQIGVCLPCLVNHEHVSVSEKYPQSRAALTLEV